MGNKRKASVLEAQDTFGQHHHYNHFHPYSSPSTATNRTSPLPSLASSPFSSTSTATIITPPPHPTSSYAQSWSWNSSAIPYLNSRTRKRYRDNRPDDAEVHDTTMKKLYDAQRLHLDEAMPISEVLAMDLDQDQQELEAEDSMDFGHCEDYTDDWDTRHPVGGPTTAGVAHMKQSTLDGFFGRKPNPELAPSQSQSQSSSYSCEQAQRQTTLSGPLCWPTVDKGGYSPLPQGFPALVLTTI